MTMPKFESVATAVVNQHGTRWTHWKADLAHGTNLHSADQLTEAYEAGKQDQAAELEAARAEIERLENQVQARDAELWGRTQKILQLEQQLAAEQAKNVGLRDFIARAQVSSGVCCCGEPMDGHSSPMSCGHSPVDMWDHAVEKLLHAPSDTSTPEQSLAASELRKERDALQADNAELVAVLELLSKYIAYNGDDWVQRTALEALAKVRKP